MYIDGGKSKEQQQHAGERERERILLEKQKCFAIAVDVQKRIYADRTENRAAYHRHTMVVKSGITDFSFLMSTINNRGERKKDGREQGIYADNKTIDCGISFLE